MEITYTNQKAQYVPHIYDSKNVKNEMTFDVDYAITLQWVLKIWHNTIYLPSYSLILVTLHLTHQLILSFEVLL